MNGFIRYIGIMSIACCCNVSADEIQQESPSTDNPGKVVQDTPVNYRPDFSVNTGLELFRWQEFDTDGIRLLTEFGPRLFISGALANKGSVKKGFIYEASIKGYAGNVDYDGQDSNGVFTSSETAYSGFSLEAEGGLRTTSKINVDLLAGLGINAWEREINDNINAEGSLVSGITEEYSIQYSMLALGLPHRIMNAKGYLKLGFKRPFATDEDVDNFNVSLSPGKKLSGFVSYKMTFDSDEKDRVMGPSIMIYYDSYRFSKSATEVAVINNVPLQVRQPKSNLEVIGIAIGFSI